MAYEWTCPFCARDTTITDNDVQVEITEMRIKNVLGPQLLLSSFIVCPNPKCKKYTFELKLQGFEPYTEFDGFKHVEMRKMGVRHLDVRLVPPSSAKVFPDFIPAAVRSDYEEACAIRDLSPKASATLSRRCLQGMIRDFWNIKKPRLVEEIQELQSPRARAVGGRDVRYTTPS